MDMKRFFLYAIVIAALALAGCGSDGNGGMTGMPPDTGPTDAQKIETAQMEADEAVTAAQAAVDKAKALPHADDPDTAEQIMAAETALTAAQAAKAKADAADVTVADAEAAAAEAEEEQGNAEAAYAMAKTASDIAVGKANDARVAAATKAAATKRTAIAAEAAQSGTGDSPDAGLGGGGGVDSGGTAVAAVTTYLLAIERDRSATTVKITDSAMAGDDDPKFMQAMDLGNGLTMHTRTMEADDDGNVAEEVVMVKTDIEAPEAIEFDKWEGRDENGAATMPQMLNARADGTPPVDDDEDATNNSDSLSIVAGNLMQVSADDFSASSGAGTVTFDADDSNTKENEAAMISGTFNGAMGTYVCTGTIDCTVEIVDGELSGVTGGWVFTPDEGATSDQPDYDYLHYGFWLKKTTDEDGVLTYNEVETFANSSITPAGANLGPAGEAKYDGDAVGVYVRETYKTTDGTVDTATSGHFTADVSLRAVFGTTDTSIAADDHETITGTIDGFALSGGEDASNWSVAVRASINSSDGTLTTGTAKGGVEDKNGSFTGTFHVPDANTNTGDDAINPTVLVGEFNADFSNGAVAGAYGARKQVMMEQ